MKNANPITQNSPNALKIWLLAARPKTWIASLSPVLIATALAKKEGPIDLSFFWLTLLFSLLIQVGTNFSNDAFDFIQGADTEDRVGPKRAVEQGWISPRAMFIGAALAFAAAFGIAWPLMRFAGWWSAPLALAAIVCGVLYTAGRRSLGYLGLGEVFVFIFFGPFAGCGTYFLQRGSISFLALITSCIPGFFSCALLIANNLRDERTDRLANKKTLVVRMGRPFGIAEYVFCLASPLILSIIYFRVSWQLLAITLPYAFLLPWIKKGLKERPKTEVLLPITAGLFICFTILFSLACYAS